MPRKGPAIKRPLVTDPVYGSPLVTALVNKVLLNGKRSLAERIVYGALEGCREQDRQRPSGDAQARAGQRQADPRGPQPPGRRCDLPGPGRGARLPEHHAGAALAGLLLARRAGRRR